MNEPKFMQEVHANKEHHIIRHITSFNRALSILRERKIYGCEGIINHEGYPHFLYDGWDNYNVLPLDSGDYGRISLWFSYKGPARYTGLTGRAPEPGWLEIYPLLNEELPWQCSLHPRSGELRFSNAEVHYPDIPDSRPSIFSLLFHSDREMKKLSWALAKEIKLSAFERRLIAPSTW